MWIWPCAYWAALGGEWPPRQVELSFPLNQHWCGHIWNSVSCVSPFMRSREELERAQRIFAKMELGAMYGKAERPGLLWPVEADARGSVVVGWGRLKVAYRDDRMFFWQWERVWGRKTTRNCRFGGPGWMGGGRNVIQKVVLCCYRWLRGNLWSAHSFVFRGTASEDGDKSVKKGHAGMRTRWGCGWDVYNLQVNRHRCRTEQESLQWRWLRVRARLEGSSRTKAFVPLAMADVSATEAYDETHCPHGTGASFPPWMPQGGWEVSYLWPSLDITKPISYCPRKNPEPCRRDRISLLQVGWWSGLGVLLDKYIKALLSNRATCTVPLPACHNCLQFSALTGPWGGFVSNGPPRHFSISLWLCLLK